MYMHNHKRNQGERGPFPSFFKFFRSKFFKKGIKRKVFDTSPTLRFHAHIRTHTRTTQQGNLSGKELAVTRFLLGVIQCIAAFVFLAHSVNDEHHEKSGAQEAHHCTANNASQNAWL